jgi:hypothetical protein
VSRDTVAEFGDTFDTHEFDAVGHEMDPIDVHGRIAGYVYFSGIRHLRATQRGLIQEVFVGPPGDALSGHIPSLKRLVVENINRQWGEPAMRMVSFRRRGASVRPVSDVAERFEQLADQWERETGFSSSMEEIVSHPAYLGIVAMGLQALPFIFERLEDVAAAWFPALQAIVGRDVAQEADTAEEAITAWLEWGNEHGYLG